MSIYDGSYCGCIWHHGVKGQKWGVRRTPEQLGRVETAIGSLAMEEKGGKMGNGVYHSNKGFTVAAAKLDKYLLNPAQPHAKEFFDVGYTENDSDLLFKHIEEEFDLSKKDGDRISERGQEQFRIPMELGVTEKKTFTTSWQIDKEGDEPKLTSAYRDRRNKGE